MSTSPARAHLAILALAALLPSRSARADEPPRAPDVAALERRIADLEARERAREEAARAAPKPAPSTGGARVTAAPGRGFTVTTADDRFSLTLRARAQIRSTFTFDEASAGTHELNIKTVRLTTQGHVLHRDLRYTIQLALGGNDFDEANPSPIFDAWVEYVGLRDLNVRVGQFFVPFDRARTVREFALQFVDRPLVVRELTLDRDVGLMLSSSDLFGSRVLGYHLFIGNGEGRNRFGGYAPGPLVVGRVVLRPWGTFDDDQEGDLTRERRPRLAFGVAGAYNHRTTRQSSTYGATYTLGTADYTHAAADLVFKYAGFSLLGEVVLRRAAEDAIDGVEGGAPKREWTRSGHGYVAQAGMMVNPLLEVTARWEQLFATTATDPKFRELAGTLGNQLGGGMNLYLNGHAFKLQSDYIYAFGRDPGAVPRHVVRLQLDASF